MRDDSVQLRFTRALVDEWARHGVRRAFISPGSRTTPLVLALDEHPSIKTTTYIDERGCGFAGLGAALASGVPSVIACTSGTAGTHFFGAIAEANLSNVPLIVCTADRPPELTAVGAPQAIDQTDMYRNHVRFSLSPGLPEMSTANTWRSIGSRIYCEATGNQPGPVHLNLAFAEPFLPADLTKALPPHGRPDNGAWHSVVTDGHANEDSLDDIAAMLSNKSGLIVAGASQTSPTEVIRLANALSWPLIAAPQARIPGKICITAFDQLLRCPAWAETAKPEIVVRFGELLASKALTQFIDNSGAQLINIDQGRWSNPTHSSSVVLPGSQWAKLLTSAKLKPAPNTWLDKWDAANAIASDVVETALDDSDYLSGPEIARQVAAATDSSTSIFLASSMPIRDFEWFVSGQGQPVYANRGANGIDGLVATATGLSSECGRTFAVIGDIALLHDSTSLMELARSTVDLTIIVVDNGGGQIFTHLPQADQLSPEQFSRLFVTTREVDLTGLCKAAGLPVHTWSSGPLSEAVGTEPGPKVVVAKSGNDRALFDSIQARIVEALS